MGHEHASLLANLENGPTANLLGTWGIYYIDYDICSNKTFTILPDVGREGGPARVGVHVPEVAEVGDVVPKGS